MNTQPFCRGAETIFSSDEFNSPTTTIALTLLCGFTLMLFVEQVISPDHTHGHDGYILASASSGDAPQGRDLSQSRSSRANPITLGLVIHSLADGLALGASSGSSAGGGIRDNPLMLIVFFALLIHKAPTSLALSSALLPLLPRPQIRVHLAIFAAATPIGALLAYLLLSLFSSQNGNKWGGIALAFSGGTFLYVATILRPVREETRASAEEGSPAVEDTKMGKMVRLLLIVAGIFTPLSMSLAIGHKNGHS
jgi:zinc transporter 9